MKTTSFVVIIVSVLALTVPIGVSAACVAGDAAISPDTPENLQDIVCIFTNVISSVLPIVIGLAMVVFFWGVAQFIRAAGDEEKVKEGKRLMFWGVIGLFIMISVWGFVQILYSSIFGGGDSIGIPLLPTSSTPPPPPGP